MSTAPTPHDLPPPISGSTVSPAADRPGPGLGLTHNDALSDARTIGLVGLAHGCSHFHHLLLPPLFPVFAQTFGLSYVELGWLVTVFFVVSGVGQALAGFAVDRLGARPLLWAALGCFVAASTTAALATGYGGLVLAAALAGLGNAPFHPADFTILNQRVAPARLGHAFSIHGISGNLGWAAAPVCLIGLTSLTGHWRAAYAVVAVLGLIVLAVLVWQRDALAPHPAPASAAPMSGSQPSAGANRAAPGRQPTTALPLTSEHPLAFLRLPSVWLCFSFFFWTTAALSAVQSFASPALGQLYGLPATATAFVVTGYMLSGAVGMVVGGFLVARVARLERTIGVAMTLAAGLLWLASLSWLPGIWAAGAVALAGLGSGLAGPSRDMLIKRAAPPGATGRVYGMVYSGLDLGFAVAAPVFGALLDHGQPAAVFQGAALVMGLGVMSAAWVGRRVAAQA